MNKWLKNRESWPIESDCFIEAQVEIYTSMPTSISTGNSELYKWILYMTDEGILQRISPDPERDEYFDVVFRKSREGDRWRYIDKNQKMAYL